MEIRWCWWQRKRKEKPKQIKWNNAWAHFFRALHFIHCKGTKTSTTTASLYLHAFALHIIQCILVEYEHNTMMIIILLFLCVTFEREKRWLSIKMGSKQIIKREPTQIHAIDNYSPVVCTISNVPSNHFSHYLCAIISVHSICATDSKCWPLESSCILMRTKTVLNFKLSMYQKGILLDPFFMGVALPSRVCTSSCARGHTF